MDDRELTLIVVPYGDLETRSFVITYGRLKVLLAIAVALALGLAFLLALMFPIAATAARVPALEKELMTLESDRARVAELARTLSDVEAQYEKVRQLLGADAPVAGAPPMLPPLRSDSPASEEPGPISLSDPARGWPLTTRRFVTHQTE
jgi:hypothetical protein